MLHCPPSWSATWRQSEHTDRNVLLKQPVPFRTTTTQKYIFTWYYRKPLSVKLPQCKVSNSGQPQLPTSQVRGQYYLFVHVFSALLLFHHLMRLDNRASLQSLQMEERHSHPVLHRWETSAWRCSWPNDLRCLFLNDQLLPARKSEIKFVQIRLNFNPK